MISRSSLLLMISMIGIGCGPGASPGLSQEQTELLRLSCDTMQYPYMDTGLGFLLALPAGFEAIGDPPSEMRAVAKSVRDTFTVIFVEPVDQFDFSLWGEVEIEHTVSDSLEIRRLVKQNVTGNAIHQYVFFRNGNGLFVTGLSPLDVKSLLDCFVLKHEQQKGANE